MKDRKPQNSALLIATLGVYLGLVLAGAAPQVLANAALSKQFNVRDEIEFKDDLDNKPDLTLEATSQTPRKANRHVSTSIQKFLARFQPAAAFDTFGAIPAPHHRPATCILRVPVASTAFDSDHISPIDSILAITSFPRGSL